jgi:hypothetical protein
MIPERRGPEGSIRPGRLRRKVGLEIPLRGRLIGENRGLHFGPPLWHDALVLGCLILGPLFSILAYFGFLDLPLWLGIAVGFAGAWGYMSAERMTIDLRARTYARREGDGPFKRVSRGRLDDLDALVMLSEQYPVPSLTGRLVIYRLVLYWKNQREPLLVAAREEAVVSHTGHINQAAGRLINDGARFARAMNLPFYDNSHYHSPAPLPPI